MRCGVVVGAVVLAGVLAGGTARAEVLVSDQVVVGLCSDGSLVAGDRSVGLLFDPDGAWGDAPLGLDFLLPGRPWEVWSAAYSVGGRARSIVAGCPELAGGPSLTWSEVEWNGFAEWVEAEATLTDLTVHVDFELPARVPVLLITMTVTARVDLTDLWLARTVDADQDEAFGTYDTTNEGGAGYAVASGERSGRALALAAEGGHGSVCRTWCTTPAEVVAGSAGPSTADQVIGVAVEVGDLAAGASARVVFAYGLGADGPEARDLAVEAAAEADHDGDGLGPDEGDCDDRDPTVAAGLPEVADGVDNDCDGAIDEGTGAVDDDGDGYTEADGDCDDGDPRVHPDAEPVDGLVDADCDGLPDEEGWPRDGGPPEGWGEAEDGGADGDADGDGDADADADADADGDDGGPAADGGEGGDEGGCGCSAAPGAGGGLPMLLGLGVLAALRRRRRRAGGRARARLLGAALLAAALALLLAGCSGGEGSGTDGDADTDGDSDGDGDGDTDVDVDADVDGDGDSDGDPWVWVDLAVTLPDGPVIDPKLAGEPSLAAHVGSDEALPSSCTVTVEALGPTGRSALLADEEPWPDGGLDLAWDGLADDGLPLDPGPVQIVAELSCTERMQGFGDAWATVLRLGVVAVDLAGDAVPLAYHKLNLWERGITRLGGPIPELLADRESPLELGDLDGDDGLPREPPPPWPDPASPPWGAGAPGAIGLGSHNVPVAFVGGDTISLTATFGATAVSAARGVAVPAAGPPGWEGDVPPVRPVLEGFSAVEPATWAPGGTATFRADAPLARIIDRQDLVLRWSYQVETDEGWVDVPGYHETTHRVYVVAGPSMVPDGTAIEASPPVAWIGVLEDLAPAVTGLPSDDPGGLMTALRTMVFNDPWIIYNPGDGAYSDFEGDYLDWTAIWIEMSEWLDRLDGIDMYCHSMACLLSSLANHLGLDARYVTIGRDFSTNMTRAAGETEWRTWRFNSHGVTTLGDSGLIWDGAVDLDGDDRPGSAPVTPVSPVAVPLADYFRLLSPDPLRILLSGTCFVY